MVAGILQRATVLILEVVALMCRSRLSQVFEHLVVFGEAAFLVFGEDDVVVQGDFEGAAAGRDELQALDVLFVLIQHLFRQTDGFREVASRGAVFDAETLLLGHGCTPLGALLRVPIHLPQYDSLRARGSMRGVVLLH